MKKLFILILMLSGVLTAQQTEFIIGAEHVSAMGRFDGYGGVPHNTEYWNKVKEFGLNWAGLKYSQVYQTYGSVPVSNILNDISRAEQNGIKVFIYNGFDRDEAGNHYYPKRWVYQVEKAGDSNVDFLNINTVLNDNDDGATTHWDLALDQNPYNYIRLLPGQVPYWQVVGNLREQNLQMDGQKYYLKIKMRLPLATTFENVPICTVKVHYKEGSELGGIVSANQFSNNDWKEITVLCFMKTPEGPVDCIPNNPSDIYNLPDTSEINQIPNYIPNEEVTFTPYDYQIYWNSTAPYNYTLDIDYIAVDDVNAHRLYEGEFDARIQDFAINYKNEAGIINFQVWDEPFRENLFIVKKIQSILYNAGVGNKEPICYRAFFDEPVPNKKFLYESNMQVLLSTIYPIPYYFYGTADTFVKPGEPNYTDRLQSRLQSHLISPLRGLINESVNFEKPFWFTVQAHKWAVIPTPNNPAGQMWHREPSAYEIKVMANLAVCYGAKGIIYYLYAHNYKNRNEIAGLYYHDTNNFNGSPRYLDEYNYPKWKTIKQLNQNLALIGNELLSLKWRDKVWSIHNGQPNSGYITHLQSLNGSNPDPREETYIELSEFKKINEEQNDNLEYFFIVNRRTLQDDARDIRVQYDKSATNPDNWQNWIIKEVGTDSFWIDVEIGGFTTYYTEGEGKLFRLEPVVMGGGNLEIDEIILGTVELKEDLTIESGVTLTLNADYNCYGNITLNGGKIVGNGKLVFHNNKRITTVN